jgi:hypothetical protein
MDGGSPVSDSKRNFILQQGFDEPRPESCSPQFDALTFQPKLVAVWLVLGILFQSTWMFLALSAALWMGALLPRLNPFEAVYRAAVGAYPFTPAPAPRRFSNGMAATFSLAIGWCLYWDLRLAAFIVEAFFLAAVIVLSFGRLCLGSFIFHLLSGRAAFAVRTLPWKKGDE